MRSLLHHLAILRSFFILIIPSVSSFPFPFPSPSPSPATPKSYTPPLLPHLLNTTTLLPSPPPTPLTLSVWPTLPWWTKLRNPRLDPPSYLDIFALFPTTHPATQHQATILQESILLPLAVRIHEGPGPWANESVMMEVGGVGATWLPWGEGLVEREVVATALVALADAENAFGVRGVRGGVRVGSVEVGSLVVWVGGRSVAKFSGGETMGFW